MIMPIPSPSSDPAAGGGSRLAAVKFLLASLTGMALFLMPIPWEGETTVLLSHVNGLVKAHLIGGVLGYGALVALVTLVMSLAASLGRWQWILDRPVLKQVFVATRLALAVRVAGALVYLAVYFQFGPSWLVGESTGGLVVNGFIGGLLVTFTLGNLILPFLMDFGLLEFMGDVLRPVMRRLFNVPGRSAVDAVASFVGDGTLGIIVTDMQYAQGYYTKREAALIATSFSVVGIAFATFVAEELGFADRFALFYGTIILTSLVVALLMARLPVIRRYPMEYYHEAGKQLEESTAKVNVAHAYHLALTRAEGAGWGAFGRMLPTIFNIHMTFIPVIVLVGTCGLVLAEYTPLFAWVSAPLVPLYEWLGVPEARLVAEASLVGFADMYLPTIFIKDVESEMARFIVGTLSFTQLIFMAETGSILLRTRMKFHFFEVLGFFLTRTALSLPVIVLVAHWVF